jgi:hypothetical protein
MSTALHPVHWSLRGLQRQPRGLERMTVPSEIKDGLVNIALSIFTDMSNSGQPFQDALLAVYLSGIEHGQAAGSPAPESTSQTPAKSLK